MNEQIKELFKQAGGHTSVRNLASNPVQVVETHELWDDRIEKFAELIVRECLSQLQDSVPLEVTAGKLQGLVDAASRTTLDIKIAKIKQHFGVKE